MALIGKGIFSLLIWFSTYNLLYGQSIVSKKNETFITDVKISISGTIAPTYFDWSEVLRRQRSPDVLQTLDISFSALYRVSENFFMGGDFLYKNSNERLTSQIGFQLPAELQATWVVPSIVCALVPLQPLNDGALVKFTVGIGPLFGSLSENVRSFPKFQKYQFSGAALLGEFTFGIGLTEWAVATLNFGLRAGITGNADSELTTIDNEQPTLSFVSLGFGIGLGFKL